MRLCYSDDMSMAQSQIFVNTRKYSSLATVIVIFLSLILSQFIKESTMTWQIIIALIALAIGIPHGALDHLVTLPRASMSKMVFFITIYTTIAAISVWAILMWPLAGFVGVVIMSSLHFGVGDAAFISELDSVQEQKGSNRVAQTFYALSSGTLPVIIPLTNEKSVTALQSVNKDLLNWHRGFANELMIMTISLFILALIAQIIFRRYRDTLDLSILFLLAMIAPPLLAFAAYFGLWHAMRHTARLTSNLKTSSRLIQDNKAAAAFRSAIIPGIPALLATFIAALGVTSFTEGGFGNQYLWISLVLVWALTVPHMMVTAKLDRRALG